MAKFPRKLNNHNMATPTLVFCWLTNRRYGKTHVVRTASGSGVSSERESSRLLTSILPVVQTWPVESTPHTYANRHNSDRDYNDVSNAKYLRQMRQPWHGNTSTCNWYQIRARACKTHAVERDQRGILSRSDWRAEVTGRQESDTRYGV